MTVTGFIRWDCEDGPATSEPLLLEMDGEVSLTWREPPIEIVVTASSRAEADEYLCLLSESIFNQIEGQQ